MVLVSWSLPVAPVREVEEDNSENIPSTRSGSTAGDREIELKGDQFEEMTDSKLKLGSLELWALGVSTALGGQYYLWNVGLAIGFGGMIVGFFLIASAYGCLILCMAELSGALPFAGRCIVFLVFMSDDKYNNFGFEIDRRCVRYCSGHAGLAPRFPGGLV